MTDLREHFYQTKNIEFLKNTLGKELWIQVSGNRNMDANALRELYPAGIPRGIPTV